MSLNGMFYAAIIGVCKVHVFGLLQVCSTVWQACIWYFDRISFEDPVLNYESFGAMYKCDR